MKKVVYTDTKENVLKFIQLPQIPLTPYYCLMYNTELRGMDTA